MKFVMSLPIDDRKKICVMYVYACVSETAYLWHLRFALFLFLSHYHVAWHSFFMQIKCTKMWILDAQLISASDPILVQVPLQSGLQNKDRAGLEETLYWFGTCYK